MIAGWPFDSLLEKVYLPYFQKHGELAIPFFVNNALSKKAFLSAYKRLEPIEKMEDAEKKEMKAYVIATFPNKTTEEKLDACKIVYALGNLL